MIHQGMDLGVPAVRPPQASTRGPSRFLRLIVIARVLLGQLLALRRYSRQGGRDSAAPERFCSALIALGPAFVKLGQILSTRPDVLPQAYVDALGRLQEHAPHVESGAIRCVVEAELGAPVECCFSAFEAAPVAAASLAQVHRASLPDGTAVAVKVQRPGIDSLVRRDLDTLAWAMRWLARLFPRRVARTNLVAFLEEFRRYTLQELDFAHEGRAIDRFRKNFAGRDDVEFPRVFWSYTSRRVLTMSWAQGMRLREAAAELDGPARQTLVRRLVDVLLKMFVSDGLFHADLHPGNIFFYRDGTFTLLDFGMYGELTAAQRDRFILYWFAVVQRQTRRAFHHFKAQTRPLTGADEAAFFERFAELAERFYASRLSEMSFTKVYLEMMKAGYAHGFVFPSELMLHAKALTTAETLIFVLAPDARFEALSRPYIAREYVARAASLAQLKRRASQLLPELLLLGELPPAAAIDEQWDWDATEELFSELGQRFGASLRGSLEHGGLWKALLANHARTVLDESRPDLPAQRLLTEAWERYYELEPSLSVELTLGATFTTHLAAATLALHDALRRHGVAVEDSYQLIYDIGWRFYEHMAEPPLMLASALSRDPEKKLRLATDMFRLFPFGSPSYRWRDLPSGGGAVRFDCTRCPVAEFFAKHQASELCARTWCQLDFPLAEKWGARLERTSTLASGAPCCDFRWIVKRSGDRKPREYREALRQQ